MTKNYIEIEAKECKGCRLCIEACPRQCIAMGSKINELGYQYAKFVKNECTACGFCFYSCPEPGAITVHKVV
jgi:NAD-dependent dihydropyrimidine dehydrogenase PreA subunit